MSQRQEQLKSGDRTTRMISIDVQTEAKKQELINKQQLSKLNIVTQEKSV